jgi:NTE family protein
MKTALVLCGGGSLGSYEIGAWKYFREKGMKFDIVTGTSIGSINGAMVVSDEFEKAEELWKQISSDKVMVNGLNFYSGFLKDMDKKTNERLWAFAKTFFKNRGADITPLSELIKVTIDTKKIKESPIQFGIVTTVLPSLKEVDVLINDTSEEKILDYLHASSACYPIFPIYQIDGKKYIDGGYNNNLPIDFAIRLGADRVVAVLLHAIPRMPQHPELMDLPFVTTIRPSRDTGSIMDFDGLVANNNMTLGYNDAKKTFGDAWGRSFTFEKDPSFEPLFESFTLGLAKHHPYDFFEITKSLSYEDVQPKKPQQIFIRSIELMGEWAGLDYLPIYALNDFIQACLKKIRSEEKKDEVLAFAKKYNYGLPLTSKEKMPLLGYLDYLTKRKMRMNKLDEIGKRNPMVFALKELFLILNEKGLLK